MSQASAIGLSLRQTEIVGGARHLTGIPGVLTAREAFIRAHQSPALDRCHTCKCAIALASADQIHCPGAHDSLLFCGIDCYEHHVQRIHKHEADVYSVASRMRHGSLPFDRRRDATCMAHMCFDCMENEKIRVTTHFGAHHMQMHHKRARCASCGATFLLTGATTVATAYCRDGCVDGPFCSARCKASHAESHRGRVADAPSDPLGASHIPMDLCSELSLTPPLPTPPPVLPAAPASTPAAAAAASQLVVPAASTPLAASLHSVAPLSAMSAPMKTRDASKRRLPHRFRDT